jgi:DNA integrity scanning protein DisA with diadenylate cyclase activity
VNIWIERIGFLAPDWKDFLEIAIVAAVVYRVLMVLAGTRAIQMLLGGFIIVTIYALARVLDLQLVEYLLETVFQFGVIAALVVFQPELRNALAQLGQNRLLRMFTRLEQTQVAEEVVQAVEEMSRGKVGAIIAIEREVGLGEYMESGTPLQARVSDALLMNIFTPYSLLHDGAAVIRGRGHRRRGGDPPPHPAAGVRPHPRHPPPGGARPLGRDGRAGGGGVGGDGDHHPRPRGAALPQPGRRRAPGDAGGGPPAPGRPPADAPPPLSPGTGACCRASRRGI